MKKLFKLSSIKYLLAFLIPAIFVMINMPQLDNDTWFCLAEGRQITQHGIYYTDELSMHEDFSVVVQNYGFAVIFYLLYSLFGPIGLYVTLLLINFLICFLIYKICMLLSNKNTNLSLIIMIAANILLATFFITTRAQVLSYASLLTLIYILESYVKTGNKRYLIPIPFLSFLQINIHASLWLAIFLILLTYIIDSLRIPKLPLQGYKTKPLIIVGVISLLVGLLNPYGISMISFIFKSYAHPDIVNLVAEMQPFSLFRWKTKALYAAIALSLFLYIFSKNRKIKIRHFLMFFGFLALGINTQKAMSQFILVMLIPISYLYSNFKLKTFKKPNKNKAVILWSAIIIIPVFFGALCVRLTELKNYPNEAIYAALNKIDKSVAEKAQDKQTLKIYSNYDDGGYVEFRGYKSYLDPRAEVFLKVNNHKKNILREWLKFRNKEIGVQEFLDKYHFDYLLVRAPSPFFEMENQGYQLIYKNSDYDVEVYKQID